MQLLSSHKLGAIGMSQIYLTNICRILHLPLLFHPQFAQHFTRIHVHAVCEDLYRRSLSANSCNCSAMILRLLRLITVICGLKLANCNSRNSPCSSPRWHRRAVRVFVLKPARTRRARFFCLLLLLSLWTLLIAHSRYLRTYTYRKCVTTYACICALCIIKPSPCCEIKLSHLAFWSNEITNIHISYFVYLLLQEWRIMHICKHIFIVIVYSQIYKYALL